MTEEIKITLNSAEAQADINQLSEKADKVSETVNEKMNQAEAVTDITWLKAAATVQQIQSILSRSLSVAGITLSRVANATIQMVTRAAATLVPLLNSQVLSGWQTATAVLGLIELGISLYELPYLILEEQEAGNMDISFLDSINMDIGNIGFNTG